MIPYRLDINMASLKASSQCNIERSTGTTNLEPLDEDLGTIAVKFTPEELRELNAAAAKIVVHGERPRKELLVMSGREAPPKT
jgi:hypothetical protein